MKKKKDVRYFIRVKNMWFVDGRVGTLEDLLPKQSFSSDRICRTSAKCWRIVNSLAIAGHDITYVEKRWTQKGRRFCTTWEVKT